MTDEPRAERPLRTHKRWAGHRFAIVASACGLVSEGCVVSESRSAVEDCVTCERPHPDEPLACGATDAASFASLDGEPAYFGFATTLTADIPHVLRIALDGERMLARVDGANATAELGESLHVHTTDAAGRSLDFELCVGGFEAGRVSRCSGARCEYGSVALLPLVGSELASATPRRGFDGGVARDASVDAGATPELEVEPLAEYAGASWPSEPTLDLDVSEQLVVLARGADGLRVLEMSDGERPAFTETLHVAAERGDFYNDVVLLEERWALAASLKYGMVVAELGSEEALSVPQPVLALGERANGHNLFLAGDVVYVARSGKAGGVSLVDVSDPASPRVVTNITLPGCANVHDLHVAGDRAYVNCFDVGLFVVDISQESDWQIVERIDQLRSHSSWVVERGERDLVVFSAEDFASPLRVAWYEEGAGFEHLGELRTGAASSVHNLHCVGRRCLVSAYQAGWLVLDLSRPEAPELQSGATTWDGPGISFYEGASGIALFAERVFVADTERGLLVYGRGTPAP